MKISSCPDDWSRKVINNEPGRNWVRNQVLSAKGIVQLHICDFFFFSFRSLIVLSPPPLQKMKEYLEGRNLITKLQAKHDLLQKTLGESECGVTAGCLH